MTDKPILVEGFFKSITPNYVFGEQCSDVPDYSQEDNHCISKLIQSRINSSSIENSDVVKDINCFFVHPTGFFLKDWNFDLNKETATFQRTELMLATQASAFNGISNICSSIGRLHLLQFQPINMNQV